MLVVFLSNRTWDLIRSFLIQFSKVSDEVNYTFEILNDMSKKNDKIYILKKYLDYETHTIIIGEVYKSHNDDGFDTLMYANGKYL